MLRKDDRKLRAKKKITPMMQQWYEIKSKYKDYIILFRAGDFYETFNEDAEIASRVLNITLTSRTVGDKKYPLAGVPYHAVDSYIAKLVENGYRVAIVEQLEDPKTAKKVVKRGVVQLVTRGTITIPESLGKSQNYLVAIAYEKKEYGLAALDLSTGEFLAGEFSGERAKKELEIELMRLNPSEILVEEDLWEALDIYIDISKTTKTFREDYYFDVEQGRDELCRLFNTLSLEGFGIDDNSIAVGAAGAIIRYLKETQMQESFPNITKLTPLSNKDTMMLDTYSIKSLELVKNLREGTSYGTLLHVLDNCKTANGSRLLVSWLLRPLLDVNKINKRLDATEEMVEHILEREEIRDLLGKMSDIERIIGRVCLGKCKPRELLALKTSLEVIPSIIQILKDKFNSELMNEIRDNLDPAEEVVKIIKASISDDAPASLKDGGVIKEGYNKTLDELRAISHGGKSFLTNLEAREKQRTGIKNLKVRYNKVFGYYIEVPKGSIDKVPPDYERKQTLVNAERYITQELKEYEEKILNAEEKIAELEAQLYEEVLKEVAKYTEIIQRDAYYCAVLDVISTFAQNAAYNNYTKPIITESQILEIKNGRHPVVEKLLREGQFIPNDCYLDENTHRILIITGPNMGGKCITEDTYIFSDQGILPIIRFKPKDITEGTFKELRVTVIGKEGKNRTSHFYYDGIQDTIRITTEKGYTIEGTLNHPIFVRTKEGTEEWKLLSQLEPEDYVIINRNNDLWGKDIKLTFELKEHSQNSTYFPKEISEDLAYLIGLLLSNGDLTHKDSYYLSTTDSYISNEFSRINKEIFNYDVQLENGGHNYYVKDREIRDFLYQIGLNYWHNYEKEIPEIILKAPKNIIKATLQGLFDANGILKEENRKVIFSSPSLKMLRQVQIILLNYGIISSLNEKREKDEKIYEISITGVNAVLFYDKINFKSPKKKITELPAESQITDDSIPYIKPLILKIQNRYLESAKKKNRGEIDYHSKIESICNNCLSDSGVISFLELKELIDYCKNNNIKCEELDELERIFNNHYYYDAITKIESSKAPVYDFSVPETHSFVGNGFINHNSTYLRQVALIVLMGQIGSFVPADEAKIGIVDRIFTRIGAHDILVEHRSTFLQEMYECANILNNATERSLIILDEVGRGTSTFDGVAIAWAITEYLHNNIGTLAPRVLFATHYHELIELEELLPRVKNYHVTVKNINGEIHFLYKVKRHGIDESYGVHVAALAGLPSRVIERANEILSLLHERMSEEEKRLETIESKPVITKAKRKKRLKQTTLLGEIVLQDKSPKTGYSLPSVKESDKDRLIESLVKIDINKITPIEAINILDQLVRKAKRIRKNKLG